jgi:hypothetical protein
MRFDCDVWSHVVYPAKIERVISFDIVRYRPISLTILIGHCHQYRCIRWRMNIVSISPVYLCDIVSTFFWRQHFFCTRNIILRNLYDIGLRDNKRYLLIYFFIVNTDEYPISDWTIRKDIFRYLFPMHILAIWIYMKRYKNISFDIERYLNVYRALSLFSGHHIALPLWPFIWLPENGKNRGETNLLHL